MAEASFVMVAMDRITLLPEIQVRCRTHEDTVKEYTEHLNNDGEFDPIHLFVDTEARNLLADGWHRLMAHAAANRKMIKAIIHEDDPENAIKNAIEYGIEHTASHGLPPSSEDKRKMVAMALKNWPKRSDKSLSRLCRVSPNLVKKIREKGFTPNEARKKREPKAEPVSMAVVPEAAPRTRPQEIEPVAGLEEAQQKLRGSETSPLMERVKTLATWVREGRMDFPDIREVFETKEVIPMLVPKNVAAVRLVLKKGDPVDLIVSGFRVKSGVVELSVTAEDLRAALTPVAA